MSMHSAINDPSSTWASRWLTDTALGRGSFMDATGDVLVAEGMDPAAGLPLYSPLLAQPVVEACLTIPSWLWFEGPHNRAIARQRLVFRGAGNLLVRRAGLDQLAGLDRGGAAEDEGVAAFEAHD